MAVTIEDLQAAYQAMASLEAPATLEEIEILAQMLRRYAGQQAASEGSYALSERNIGSVISNLSSLLVGPAPEELDERIKGCWKETSQQWATRSTLEDFNRRIGEVLQPLDQNAERLAEAERELDVQRQRLTTLRKLTELLDELLNDVADHPLPSQGDLNEL